MFYKFFIAWSLNFLPFSFSLIILCWLLNKSVLHFQRLRLMIQLTMLPFCYSLQHTYNMFTIFLMKYEFLYSELIAPAFIKSYLMRNHPVRRTFTRRAWQHHSNQVGSQKGQSKSLSELRINSFKFLCSLGKTIELKIAGSRLKSAM